jgi:mutual gliding-motility protein MglA
MPNLNFATREITYKIVYYGTGLGGKTTNIKHVYKTLAPDTRGELVSVATETERTLFFDFLPIDLGTVREFRTRIALYTVPGQMEYNQCRKMILKAVDGIIFVADSSEIRSIENAESIQNMIENLKENQLELEDIPWILQYNKRDLADAMPIERMDKELNFAKVKHFASVASEGKEVMSTLEEITRLVMAK